MRIGWVHKLVKKWPGKKTFGMYRFLPIFFVLGASLEFSMINWRVGEFEMPVGVTWGQYASFTAAAMFSMLAGSQLVHQYYKPLQDMHEYINRELKNLPSNVQEKIRNELREEGILK